MFYCSQQKLKTAEDIQTDSNVDLTKQVALLQRRVTELEKRYGFSQLIFTMQAMPWPVSVCVRLSVCLCPSQVGVLLKWLNVG